MNGICISAITVLLICWPAEVVSDDKVIEWMKKEIPIYYVFGLGGLLLLTIIGCILCLWCQRRRGKEFFTNNAKDCSCDKNSWELIPSSKKEAKNGDSKEGDSDSVTIIKISVESTGTKKEKEKSSDSLNDHVREESPDQGEQIQGERECEEIKNEGNESGMASSHIMQAPDSVTETPYENSIEAGTNDKEHDGLGSTEGLHDMHSDKPRAEPLYAQVNKTKQGKKKGKSGYNIVYAELADFDKKRSDNSLPKNNSSSVEYAEIARLTKSPRDMSPLDD